MSAAAWGMLAYGVAFCIGRYKPTPLQTWNRCRAQRGTNTCICGHGQLPCAPTIRGTDNGMQPRSRLCQRPSEIWNVCCRAVTPCRRYSSYIREAQPLDCRSRGRGEALGGVSSPSHRAALPLIPCFAICIPATHLITDADHCPSSPTHAVLLFHYVQRPHAGV